MLGNMLVKLDSAFGSLCWRAEPTAGMYEVPLYISYISGTVYTYLHVHVEMGEYYYFVLGIILLLYVGHNINTEYYRDDGRCQMISYDTAATAIKRYRVDLHACTRRGYICTYFNTNTQYSHIGTLTEQMPPLLLILLQLHLLY